MKRGNKVKITDTGNVGYIKSVGTYEIGGPWYFLIKFDNGHKDIWVEFNQIELLGKNK